MKKIQTWWNIAKKVRQNNLPKFLFSYRYDERLNPNKTYASIAKYEI